MALTPLETIAQKLSDKRKEDLESILKISGSAAVSKNEYGVTNADAISDGDGKGRGTGVFLDTFNGGTSTDQVTKIDNIKLNKYSSKKPYNTPSTE